MRVWFTDGQRSWYWTKSSDGTLTHPMGLRYGEPPAGAARLKQFPIISGHRRKF